MRNPQVGDLNGDGKLDIVYGESAATMSNVEGRLLYALRNSDGTLGSQKVFEGFFMAQDVKMNDPIIVQFKNNQGVPGDDFGHRANAVIHDFNNDGLVDIIAASNKYSSTSITRAKDGTSLPLTVFYNQGTANSFSFSNNNAEVVKEIDGTTIQHRNMMIAYEDMDGDGKKDLVSSVGENGGLKIWKNSGENKLPVFEKPFDVNTTELDISTSNGWFMGTADLDGDGDRDITMCGFGTHLYWIENLTDKTSALPLSNMTKGMDVTVSGKSIKVSLNSDKIYTNISIIDVKGRRIFNTNEFANKFMLSCNLVSGQYWVKVSNNVRTSIHRVVVLN